MRRLDIAGIGALVTILYWGISLPVLMERQKQFYRERPALVAYERISTLEESLDETREIAQYYKQGAADASGAEKVIICLDNARNLVQQQKLALPAPQDAQAKKEWDKKVWGYVLLVPLALLGCTTITAGLFGEKKERQLI